MRGGSSGNDSAKPTLSSAGSQKFSDLVVNIDGKKVFGGMTITSGGLTYDFSRCRHAC